ncbi:hypothetical protein EDB84DRAFT_1501386 [Lactarius hengduanensis]|nr:hypothetical protein EDB84DRAFT_1501386 [Lactarius hengduanensis]
MRSFAVLTSFLLLAAGDFAAAQINAPDCSLSWKWTFNSLGQNACTVAAYMMATCNGGGDVYINALQPGYSYTGPSGVDDANLCSGNTVTYNLISACDACQSATWITYVYLCVLFTLGLSAIQLVRVLVQLYKNTNPSDVSRPLQNICFLWFGFPNAVPSGTVVPQWALLDHTVRYPCSHHPETQL